MNHLRIGHEQDRPPLLVKSHAPIKVLAMEEILFIEKTDRGHRCAAHHHAGAGNCLNVDRRRRQRLLMQQEVGKCAWEEPA